MMTAHKTKITQKVCSSYFLFSKLEKLSIKNIKFTVYSLAKKSLFFIFHQ